MIVNYFNNSYKKAEKGTGVLIGTNKFSGGKSSVPLTKSYRPKATDQNKLYIFKQKQPPRGFVCRGTCYFRCQSLGSKRNALSDTESKDTKPGNSVRKKSSYKLGLMKIIVCYQLLTAGSGGQREEDMRSNQGPLHGRLPYGAAAVPPRPLAGGPAGQPPGPWRSLHSHPGSLRPRHRIQSRRRRRNHRQVRHSH